MKLFRYKLKYKFVILKNSKIWCYILFTLKVKLWLEKYTIILFYEFERMFPIVEKTKKLTNNWQTRPQGTLEFVLNKSKETFF